MFVLRLQSIRTVLAIATEYNLGCWQLDYNTTFVSAKLKEEAYGKQAFEYEEFDATGVSMVMRAHRNLHGLLQVQNF